jgi:hypothetical protein
MLWVGEMNKFISLKLLLGLGSLCLFPVILAKVAGVDRLPWHNKSNQTNLSIAQSSAPKPSTSAQPSASAPAIADKNQQIWQCGAFGKRSYVIDRLTLNSTSFDMAIYEGDSVYGNYIGTIQVKVTDNNSGIIGHGQTANSTIEVGAMGRFPALSVKDSVAGNASGRCSVDWKLADGATRRLVRQCLAVVSGKGNDSTAEVARYGCETNPKQYMEEWKQRQNKHTTAST